MKTYVVTHHKNRLGETVLMMGHKICFYGDIWQIIPKLSLLPLLIWSTDRGKGCKLANCVYSPCSDQTAQVVQITRGNRDNLGLILQYTGLKAFVVAPH